jgi:group I intron endonuclease
MITYRVIYCFVNKLNNKIYIGSTINFEKRISNHLSLLKSNRHYNRHLQAAWNKYGEDTFVIDIIEFISNQNNLIRREQYWLDYYKSYDPKYGYNIRIKAESNCGIKWTDKSRQKMLNNRNGVGNKKSKEAIENVRLAHLGKPVKLKVRKQISLSMKKKFINGYIHPLQGKIKNPITGVYEKVSNKLKKRQSKMQKLKHKKYYLNHKQQIALYQKNYRQKNRSKLLKYLRNYRLTHVKNI